MNRNELKCRSGYHDFHRTDRQEYNGTKFICERCDLRILFYSSLTIVAQLPSMISVVLPDKVMALLRELESFYSEL